MTFCSVESPLGVTLDIVNGQALDGNGIPVPGYLGLDNGRPTKVCGIVIESMSDQDLGNWKCLMNRQSSIIMNVQGTVHKDYVYIVFAVHLYRGG